MTAAPCCQCCVAASERGELDHLVGADCPNPPCDWCQPALFDVDRSQARRIENLRAQVVGKPAEVVTR